MKTIILLLMAMAPGLVSSEIFRWVDESGNVHYGDRPSGAGAVELDIQAGESKGSEKASSESKQDENEDGSDEELTRDEKRKRLLDAMQEDRDERNKIREAEKQKKKVKRKQCARAKDRLRNLKRAASVYNLDKNGDRVYVSKEQRRKNEGNLTKAIKKHCR